MLRKSLGLTLLSAISEGFRRSILSKPCRPEKTTGGSDPENKCRDSRDLAGAKMSLCLARNKSAFEMNNVQREDVPGRLQFARHRGNFGRGEWICTTDLLVPNKVVKNSNCCLWCRLQEHSPFISLLNWSEVGLKYFSEPVSRIPSSPNRQHRSSRPFTCERRSRCC